MSEAVGANHEVRDEVLDTFDIFHGKPRSIEVLEGGLTNRNFKVTTPDDCYVVRVSPQDTSALAIDRDGEYHNSVRAADVGVGAPVISYAPEHHILIVRFVHGTTFTNDSFAIEGNIERVAQAVRTLHSAERFDNEFDMFAIQQNYLSIVQRDGYHVPAGYLEFAPHIARIADAMSTDPTPLVPCNNDLLAGNFIDDRSRIWLIDYEYSGNNDPCFELGNIWSECGLSCEQLEQLVTCYYNERLPHKIARAELQGIVAKYGWTLWASIQQAISPLDFDFGTWGMQRYDAAASLLSSRRFERLLAQLRREV